MRKDELMGARAMNSEWIKNKGRYLFEKIKIILKKILAMMIDLTYIGIIDLVVYFIADIIVKNTYIMLLEYGGIIYVIGAALIFIIVPCLYFDRGDFNGGTLGKRFVNIGVCNKDGGKVKYYQVMIKNFFNIYIIVLNIFLMPNFEIGFYGKYIVAFNLLFLLVSPKNLTFGDVVAGTRIAYRENDGSREYPEWLNIKNFVKVCVVTLIIIQLIPPRIYVEEIDDPREYRETYVFTRNRPMTDRQAFELVIEYDYNNPLETTQEVERYYFPSGALSHREKIELANYSCISEEFDRPAPLIVTYNYLERTKRYYWHPKIKYYKQTYTFKR